MSVFGAVLIFLPNSDYFRALVEVYRLEVGASLISEYTRGLDFSTLSPNFSFASISPDWVTPFLVFVSYLQGEADIADGEAVEGGAVAATTNTAPPAANPHLRSSQGPTQHSRIPRTSGPVSANP